MPTEPENHYDRRTGPRDRGLRVGDREREAVAAILRQQHIEGRLNADEFQERLERCLVAKTYRDLDELIVDLPSRQAEDGRTGRARAWPLWRMAPLPFALVPIALVVAIILSHGHLVWLAFPVLFFSLRPLMWRSWGRRSGFGYWGCGPRSSTRNEPRV